MKNRFVSMFLVFILSLIFVSCGGSESSEPGSIYGVVTDKATGDLLKSAIVELQDSDKKLVDSSKTGSEGNYYFDKIAAGSYTLYVTKSGYYPATKSVIVETGKKTSGDVPLEKASALRIVDDEENDMFELDFGSNVGDVSRQFIILNGGAGTLEWQVSFSEGWIASVSKDSGELKPNGRQGIIVNIDRNLLESGENTATIHVTSDDGNKQLAVKATNATVLPTLNTLEVTEVDTDSAVFNGEILTPGVPEYTERGFVYSTSSLPTIENTIEQLTVPLNSEAKYSTLAIALELGTTYYVRAYAINAAGTAYSTNVVSFQTHEVLPELTTEHATDISISNCSATFNGTIKYEGDPVYTERGFVYGHAHNPTVEDDNKKEVTGNGVGAFSIKVTELEMNTIYYIRAYAVNDAGTGYGSEKMLEFNSVKPIVQTNEATNINIDGGTATFNGEIGSIGDPAYTERGFVYGLTHNPTVEDDTKKSVPGNATGLFSANISELVMGEIYYIRAYATNKFGTSYGEEVELDFNAVMPVVTTSEVTAKHISGGTATFNGKIDSIGDPVYTERGFVYGLTHNPTIEDDTKKVVPGSGTGAFSANISELVMNKIYYVRAYATNVAGISYGDEVELDFKAVMPGVTTSAVTAKSISGGTATFNGSITSIGDPAYTERGFVYGLTHNPNIADDTKKVVSGTSTGAFSANVTGLAMNKIYYVRAYAANSQGRVYGAEVVADFNAVMPVVSTSAVTAINLTGGTATLNGKISNAGDPVYTERGFVYATIHNPTVEDDTKKIAAGSGTGDFSVNVSGLVLNTIYYIRAYAKSSQGISYGSEVSLTFKGTLPTVKTTSATTISIGSKTATFNGSIENVGNPAYTERGFVYGLTHNPNIADDIKKAASGSGTGAFSATVTNLAIDNTYYVRAYATNLQGTAYGDEVTLKFNAVPASVKTESVSNIDGTTATLIGNVTSAGDPAYTEKGFVYGKNPNPTTLDKKVSVSGSGTGIFTYNLTGLETQETYYVKAYVISNNNVVYGSCVSFFTVSPDYHILKSYGLMVAKNDAGIAKWDAAVNICNGSTLAGYTDWRLPTISELQSVYNNRDSIGDNFGGRFYWSSTSSGTSNALSVNFSNGSVNTTGKTVGNYVVRCVRTAN